MRSEFISPGSSYLLTDPHGGHTQVYGDDGTASSPEMVAAAIRKGVIPAKTGHNTMYGTKAYLEAMNQAGLGKVALPGVELSFYTKATTVGPITTRCLDNGYVAIGPSQEVFAKGKQENQGHTLIFSEDKIRETRMQLLRTIKDAFPFSEDFENLVTIIDTKYRKLIIQAIKSHAFQEAHNEEIHLMAGSRIALGFIDFAAFYLYYNTLHPLSSENASPIQHIANVARLFKKYQIDKNPTSKNHKGEIVLLMPNNKTLLEKMQRMVDTWREKGYFKTKSLAELFDMVSDTLTDSENNSVVRYFPHPLSIDTTAWGKFLLGFMEDSIKLYSPEIFDPKIAQKIDAIEIYNAAHPGIVNAACERVASLDIFSQKARTGASDSHHPSWVGSGATLVKTDEYSTEGILDAIKQSHTIPLSGLGKRSRGWGGFFAWIPTPNTPLHKVIPGVVFSAIEQMIDIQTPAINAVKIFSSDNVTDNLRQTDWTH